MRHLGAQLVCPMKVMSRIGSVISATD